MDQFFQVFMIAIMAFGILGLPAYFWLNARKKRLLAEYEEAQKAAKDGSSDEGESPKKDWRI